MKNVLVSVVVSALVSSGMFFLLPKVVGGGAPAAAPTVDVPNLAGLTLAQARQLLDPRGLALDLADRVDDPRYPPGTICEQHPLDASRLARGSIVRVKVVRAAERAKVPELVGRPEAEAKPMLEALKLRLGLRTERVDEKATAGTILAATPAPGAEVQPGIAVDIVVAAGAQVPVPRVTGRGVGGAKDAIKKAGFEVGEVKYGRDEDNDQGIVLRQTPAAGASALKGSKIDLVVNSTD
ncbi:MAG TPA: PASTA domain-containing protein [Polyangia bacterium]